MSTLPEPNFIDRDSQAIVAEMIADYEAMTGKSLQPAQVERLLIDLFAYRETLVRVGIQEAAKQNLVSFATAPILDYLGELVGVARLAAKPATGVVRLAFSAALITALEVPAGTLFEASGTQFQSSASQTVPAGAIAADISVEAVDPGSSGNGFLPGQINQLIDDLGVEVAAIANLGTTYGGVAEEDDERLRERIKLAPESFTVAGSVGAYRYHARSAHQDIIDVAILSPEPGVVALYPLTKTGLPSQAVIDAVSAACSDEKVRPLTDWVVVNTPVSYPYQISARLTLYRSSDNALTMAAARDAVTRFAEKNAFRLGADIVPTQISAALSVPGVYRVELVAPVSVMSVPREGWAHCTGADIQFAGWSDD